jgi:O-antigen/teichoic acid export membrane protein
VTRPDDGLAGAGHPPEEPLAADEVGRRATGGAALLAARGVLVLGLGLVANLVLARLLVPHDFGLVALGSVLIVFGGYFAEGGLGAALVRREQQPSRRDLEVVNGLQLAATTLLVLVAVAIGLPFGEDGAVVAAMTASLPITILRSPAIVVLERRLEYRTIAVAEVAESAAFYVAAVGLVAAGLGVWGVVVAMAIRAVVGSATMIRLGPLGFVRPRLALAEARPLLGFGARVQLLSVVGMTREQGLNIGIATIAGVSTLGVWNLAFRVVQVPSMIMTAASRVAFPAVARLLETGREPRAVLERGVGALAVAIGLVVVAVAGFAPALPDLVGHAWDEVPPTLAWSGIALLVNAPVYVMAAGYLYATDEVGALIRAAVAQTTAWFAVALPLLPVVGAEAVGLGWIAGATVNALLLARRIRSRTGAALLASLLPPLVAAVAAGAAGWWIATAGSETVAAGIAGGVAAELILITLLLVVRRPLLREAYGLLTASARGTPA